MKQRTNYTTKQSEAILSYIMSLDGGHVTAGQIAEHFENTEFSVGLTTIYRHLDKLICSGKVRRYISDGTTGACYQYIKENENEEEHFHLKCEGCGSLLHLRCEMLEDIQKHVSDEHEFMINPIKTVFYGKCGNCLREN